MPQRSLSLGNRTLRCDRWKGTCFVLYFFIMFPIDRRDQGNQLIETKLKLDVQFPALECFLLEWF